MGSVGGPGNGGGVHTSFFGLTRFSLQTGSSFSESTVGGHKGGVTNLGGGHSVGPYTILSGFLT